VLAICSREQQYELVKSVFPLVVNKVKNLVLMRHENKFPARTQVHIFAELPKCN